MKIYHVEAGMLATNCYFAVNEAIGEGVISIRAEIARPF